MDPITPVIPTPTPNGGEPTPKKTVEQLEAENAELARKNTELDAQRTHWKGKYERDITAVVPPVVPPSTVVVDESMSDEGKALKKEISSLNERLDAITKKDQLASVFQKNPQLKDKATEFDEFLGNPANKGLTIDQAATLFMAEHGLIGSPAPRRPGLETPTTGARPTATPRLTADEVARIRVNEPRRYEQMLRDGTLKPEEIQG